MKHRWVFGAGRLRQPAELEEPAGNNDRDGLRRRHPRGSGPGRRALGVRQLYGACAVRADGKSFRWGDNDR
jgi:hypothetical protein